MTILDCPLGFEIHRESKTCTCLHYLQLVSKDINCDNFHHTIKRPTSIWIGNFSKQIVVSNCPFDYCSQSVLEIKMTSQDDQCNSNRSGIPCGGCRNGLSVIFGTSICEECSNTYLLLILPFMLAGIGLVILSLKCNLTVSTGTLNGLIFYANIVQVNSKVFFRSYPPSYLSNLTYVLSVFIAWINLDFGIPVCFAKNLNTFG